VWNDVCGLWSIVVTESASKTTRSTAALQQCERRCEVVFVSRLLIGGRPSDDGFVAICGGIVQLSASQSVLLLLLLMMFCY